MRTSSYHIATVVALGALLMAAPACDDSPTGGPPAGYDGGLPPGWDSYPPFLDGSWTGGDGPGFEECTSLFQEAENTYQPVDIIFTIDNSPSLLDEINEVRANMNAFSKQIASSGLDAHIVVISCLPGECENPKFHGICIDPPLGKQDGCKDPAPYDDNNPPVYTHVSVKVPSTKGLERTISTYDQWKSAIRPDAVKHFVAVSDDNDEWTAAQFDSALLGLASHFKGYLYHGIFAFMSKEDACNVSTTEPCCTYAAPGGEGVVYKELVKTTGGVSGDLCEQDFDPVFKKVATSVVENARLSCNWTIPPPPEGEKLDASKINVEFVDSAGKKHIIGKVSGAEDCDKVAQAWYYDDPQTPTEVKVCPQTCAWIQGEPGATINIQFGCETELAPIE